MQSKKHGFTLIELIVVLAIIAVIAAITVPIAFGSIANAKKAACNASINSVYSQYRTIAALEADPAKSYTDEELTAFLQQAIDELHPVCPADDAAVYTPSVTAKVPLVECSYHSAKQPAQGADNDVYEKIEYVPGTGYPYGQVVTVDGVQYICVDSSLSGTRTPGSSGSGDVWRVTGNADGTAPEYTQGTKYAFGTVVTSGGKKYMLAPVDSNVNGAMPVPPNSSYWVEMKEGETYVKPPKTQVTENTVKYGSGPYKNGQVYEKNGILYRYNGDDNNTIVLEYNSVAKGTWECLATVYQYENARYKAGDKVWYAGKYYIAKQSFTTYTNAAVHMRPDSANSGYWELAE